MFERRLQILLAVLAVFCFGLVVRAFSLQAVGRRYWEEQSEKAQIDEEELPTTRGRILDVKGRELAVDQPCIDACVHYEAVAFMRSLKTLREASWARLVKADAGVTRLAPAEQRRKLEADISKLIGEGSPATLTWLRAQARQRVRRQVETYDDLLLSEKQKLLNAAVCQVIADIETMWHELAKLTNQTDEDLDEQRRQIVRRVETRRRLVWYAKYKQASEGRDDPGWIATLLGSGGPVDLDKFDVHVSEERESPVVLANIDYALRTTLAKAADRYPGMVLREGVIRVYPYKAVACQTIGRIAKVTEKTVDADPEKDDPLRKYKAFDDYGQEGLERLFERELRGTRGLAATNYGTGGETQEQPAVPGKDVQTTLDAELQTAVEQAFRHVNFVRHSELPNEDLDMPGAAVLIDVPTGEVRAMVSWPTYDLNLYNEVFPQLLRDQWRRPLTNRATQMAVEPGSTVKPVVGISAITAGVFGASDTIKCDGYVEIAGKRYTSFGNCWTMRMFKAQGGTHQQIPSAAPHPTGYLTFPEALQRSCNVFHEELAYRLGMGGVSFWFDKFGLGRPTGIGLPEAKGVLPDSFDGPAYQKMSVTCMAGIGESHVNATPIQMANIAATIARNGVAVRPTLRQGEQTERTDLHLSPVALAEAHEGMFAVVNTVAGTGRTAFMKDIVVAAKTGSAQTGPLRIKDIDAKGQPVKDDKGRYIWNEVPLGTQANPTPEAPWYRAIGRDEKTRPAHGWMIGYAPADNPKVAFAVLVEYGGGGGSAAGSIVKTMLESCADQGYLTRK